MVKPPTRSISAYAGGATRLLGAAIREGRIARKITTTELAGRAGISRALLQRIEKGDPAANIGSYFETASIVGVPLFEEDRHAMTARLRQSEEKRALLPKAVRKPRRAVKDDF